MIDKCIGIFPKTFDNSFCDSIIKSYNLAEEHGYTRSRIQSEKVGTLLKNDSSIHLEHIDESLELINTNSEIYKTFHEVFNKCYTEYRNKYDVLNQFSHHYLYTIKIQKTKPGQGYHVWHCENGSPDVCRRILAWTAYMNDDFEAGETEFLYQQYRYKPKQGDLMIFPAAFTHTHRGNPPIGGDKYIITGWVEF